MIPERRLNDISFCLNAAAVMALMLFIQCYFGNLVTDEAASVGFAVYDTDWYSYPVKLQLFIQLAIRRTDRPLTFSGHHVVVCSLENYGKVGNLKILLQNPNLYRKIFILLQLMKATASAVAVLQSISS